MRVTFQPENKTVEFPYGTMPYDGHGLPMSFLDVAENYGIFMDHACGGVSACTTCHMFLKEGGRRASRKPKTSSSTVSICAPGLQLNSRLGCQCVIEKPGTYVAEIPAWNKNYVQEGKPAAIK